jgi:hypothetical protein
MKAKYQILRVDKLKHYGKKTVVGASRHVFRDIKTPNANPSKTPLNEILGATDTKALLDAVNGLVATAKDRRTDNVLCLEYLITASPDFFAKRTGKSYFAEALGFLEKKHGKENIVCSVVHRDETTPHMSVFVVPLKDGVLNSKFFTGGAKKMSKLHSDFNDGVGKKFGLARGLQGSKAKHTTIRDFYARTKLKTPKVPTRMGLITMTDDQRMETMKTLQAQAVNAIAEVEKLEDEREVFARKISNMDSEKASLKTELEMHKAITRKTALLLKNSFSAADFAKAFGIELIGKADIFDALQKSGQAHSFDTAVALVLAKMPMKTDIVESAKWAQDFEDAPSPPLPKITVSQVVAKPPRLR